MSIDDEIGAAVLAPAGLGHGPAELLGDQLSAVADAQDRDPELVDAGVDARRALLVDRLRTTGEDEAGRLAGRQSRRR